MDAFIAIAGKGQIEPIQVPVLQCLLPLGLVIKILAELARAEQQPVATTAARRRALLHEATKRCAAGAGAEPDHIAIRIGGQAKTIIGLDEQSPPRALGRSAERRGGKGGGGTERDRGEEYQ